MPTLKEAQKAFIDGHSSELRRTPSRDEPDRHDESTHIMFFFARRAKLLTNQHPEWLDETSLSSLKSRIEVEFTALKAYVAAKVGTLNVPGPLGSTTEPGTPPPRNKTQEYEAPHVFHLDLQDVAF